MSKRVRKRIIPCFLFSVIVIMVIMGNSSSVLSAPDKVYKLVYAVPMPPFIPRVQADYAFMDYVEEKSRGRVVFDRYPGGTLCSGPEEADFIKKGAVDIGTVLAHRAPTNFPLHFLPVQNLPSWDDNLVSKLGKLLNVENAETAAILKKEAEEQNTFFLGYRFWPQVGYAGIGAKKQFTKLSDLKGEKLASVGPEPGFEKLGMTIVTYPVNTEIYEGLSRGVVDGLTFSLDGIVKMEFYKPLKCYMNIPAADVLGAHGVYTINLDKWNSLPPDIQEIFRAGVEAVTYPRLAQGGELGNDTNIKKLTDAGITVGNLSQSDTNKLVNLRNNLRKAKFLDMCEKAGKSAEAKIIIKVCDDFMAKITANN